jgi:hypothetical protein
MHRRAHDSAMLGGSVTVSKPADHRWWSVAVAAIRIGPFVENAPLDLRITPTQLEIGIC